MVALAVVFAAFTGRMAEITTAAVDSAEKAVTFSIGLAGVLALWLGLVKVGEEAGLVRAISRLFRPLLKFLFPEVPKDHPALGAIVLNLAANVLGLGNAATPFGLEAMRHLETLNPHRGTATDAQAMLVALNTASIQLVPASVIALRTAAGSATPAEILGPTLLASLFGVVVAASAARLLGPLFPKPKDERSEGGLA